MAARKGPYVIGIDASTNETKAVLLDRRVSDLMYRLSRKTGYP